MSLRKALVSIGFRESEAIIVSYLIEHKKSTVEELIDGANLSRATVYKCLKSLIRKNYVARSEKRPYEYLLTSRLLSDVKVQFDRFYKEIIAQIKPREIIESRTMLRRITNIFEKSGYAIKDPPRIRRERMPTRFRIAPYLDKIAEGEYRFGIMLIDKRKKLDYPREILPRAFPSDIWYLSRELNCVASFVFLHTDRKGYKTLGKRLKQARIPRFRTPFERHENFGIKGNEVFFFSTDENLQEKISSALQEIHQRRIIVGSMSQNLKNKLTQTQELILLSQEHARRVDSLFLTGSPFHDEAVMKHFDEISDPVQRIKNREIRNLGIFRRKFSENEVRITQSLEAIERRIFLPEVRRLERYLAELESTTEKFKCIEYELDDLRSALFKYGVDLMGVERPGQRALINPFIFTEPYEKEPFFVNEQTLEKAARLLSNSIAENFPSFFQIVSGSAGMGKTHATRYIYGPIAEKNRVKPLYIDCPLNYDLSAGIFQELTQESLFPSKLAGTVRDLRRSVPSTIRDLLRVIGEVVEIWKKQGYKGLLLVLDEIENAVPYTFFEEPRERRYRPPLALRQIREMLSQHSTPNLGFLLCCRSKIYPMLKETMKIENIEEFTVEPDILTPKDFNELIQHRYEMWSIKEGPDFEIDTIREIVSITKGNTRDVIKYLRELFDFATRNKLNKVESATIKKIGSIPLFRY